MKRLFTFFFWYIGGPQPAVLQEVNIPIWTNHECKLKYGHAAPGGIVEHFLCAGQATKDSCSVSIIGNKWKMKCADIVSSRINPVSYTHLDVYKRQDWKFLWQSTIGDF